MDETDAFFTHTIVGAPLTVLLGRRQSTARPSGEGLQVDLSHGEARLSAPWREWIVASHACDPVGLPRMRPGPLRRWMERHALWIALVGLLALAGSLITWGVLAWS